MSAPSGQTAAPMGEAQIPIADVSYRNYDGPLKAHPLRWWIIASGMLRTTLRKWWFWVPAALVLPAYFISGFLLYLRSQLPPEAADLLVHRPMSGLFYDAYHYSLFWIFILALLVGSGSIAGDNRANALQIYLSKPLTRLDYLAGKWAGVFLLLAGAALAPAVILYLYCLASYQSQGFLKDNPHLWLQILAACALTGALHASLLVGMSAWSRRPMLVGGLYAGLYVGVGVVTSFVQWILMRTGDSRVASTVGHLSLPGLLRGIAQHLYDTTPSFFGMPFGGRGRTFEIGMPDLLPLALVTAALIVIGLGAALARIRAVEVVRG